MILKDRPFQYTEIFIKMQARRRKDLHCVAWRRLRRRILDRDGYRCTACGAASRLEVDHIVPVAAGGEAYDPDNLRTLCRSCHIDRHAVNGNPEFRRWRELAQKHRGPLLHEKKT